MQYVHTFWYNKLRNREEFSSKKEEENYLKKNFKHKFEEGIYG